MQSKVSFGVSVTLAVASFLLAAPIARADIDRTGYYFGVNGGLGFVQNMTIRCRPRQLGNPSLGVNTGWGVSGKVGYSFGNGFRLEVEMPYRDNTLSSLFSGQAAVAVSGRISSMSLMSNVYYDIQALRLGSVTPHVGAGVGVSWLSMHAQTPGGAFGVDGGSTQFAYQFIGGLRYALREDLAVDLDYVYFATTNPTFQVKNGGPAGSRYASHNLRLGLTYWLPTK